MADRTKLLLLNLPNKGTSNWGEAINSNFITIDQKFVDLDKSINTLNNVNNSLNYVTFNEKCKYMKITLDENKAILSFFKEEEEETGRWEEYTTSDSSDQFNKILSLIDFQGYYVFDDYDPGTIIDLNDNSIHDIFKTKWMIGEVMVKHSTIMNNQRVANCIKFPQIMGGYYVPRVTIEPKEINGAESDTGTWNFEWIRTIPDQASRTKTDSFSFPIPYANTGFHHSLLSSETVWQSATEEGRTTYTCILPNTTYHGNDLPPSIQLMFWHKIGSSWQRVELDYTLTYNESTGKWALTIIFDRSHDPSNFSCMIEYYYSNNSWWIITTEE